MLLLIPDVILNNRYIGRTYAKNSVPCCHANLRDIQREKLALILPATSETLSFVGTASSKCT